MLPLYCFDFPGLPSIATGVPQFTTTADTANEWYYIRPNPIGVPTKSWHFVYPRHYMFAGASPPAPTPRLIDGTVYPQASAVPPIPPGISQSLRAAKNIPLSYPNFPYQLPLGDVSATRTVEAAAATISYKDIPIELNNADFGGPNGNRPDATAEPLAFPFGGFARNGDMLEVPYIGSYRLMIPLVVGGTTYQIIEMNPVTMDSMMALGLTQAAWGEPAPDMDTAAGGNPSGNDPIYDDTAGVRAAIEQVGRFCPLGTSDFLGVSNPGYASLPNDYAMPLNGANNHPLWLYHWATRLFDYLTVQSPQQDLLPDVDPTQIDPNSAVTPTGPPWPWTYAPTNSGATNQPKVVANVSNTVFNGEPANPLLQTEETVAVQGLVNINTAPWRVLAAVPWLPPIAAYANRQVDNASIGLSIAFYRDVNDGSGHPHGPFKSIFELNDVPIRLVLPNSDLPPGAGPGAVRFRNLLNGAASPPTYPVYTADQGNLSGVYGADPNPVAGDFKSQYMMINRVSNLITTRSDSFTVYVLLQGWRDAETTNATLAVQRRAAFLVDRSGVTPSNPTPKITQIPTN
jgi:hypothetical protein